MINWITSGDVNDALRKANAPITGGIVLISLPVLAMFFFGPNVKAFFGSGHIVEGQQAKGVDRQVVEQNPPWLGEIAKVDSERGFRIAVKDGTGVLRMAEICRAYTAAGADEVEVGTGNFQPFGRKDTWSAVVEPGELPILGLREDSDYLTKVYVELTCTTKETVRALRAQSKIESNGLVGTQPTDRARAEAEFEARKAQLLSDSAIR